MGTTTPVSYNTSRIQYRIALHLKQSQEVDNRLRGNGWSVGRGLAIRKQERGAWSSLNGVSRGLAPRAATGVADTIFSGSRSF